MRTTINLDDALLAEAAEFLGPMDRTTLVNEGIRALIAREAARRLALLGGSDPKASAPPRRRPDAIET